MRRCCNTCLHRNHMCFGLELLHRQISSLHRCCAQFRCSSHCLLHWNPMVLSTKRCDSRNCSYHRRSHLLSSIPDNVVASADNLAILSSIENTCVLGKNCMDVATCHYTDVVHRLNCDTIASSI
jgi:hypothetical protein